MDVSEDETVKRCFKISKQCVVNNLQALYNNNTSKQIIFWNRFQIFVYNYDEFESPFEIIKPMFQIRSMITSDVCVMCLDYNGNIYTAALETHHTSIKYIKQNFEPRQNGAVACSLYKHRYVLLLKYELDTYYLTLYTADSTFSNQFKANLICNEQLPSIQTKDKCILKSLKITEGNFGTFKQVFNLDNNIVYTEDYNLVIVCLDKRNVFGCIFNPMMSQENITLKKLYSCPSEICELQLTDDLNIIIGLSIGTLITLHLKDLHNAVITHLNTSIMKFLVLNDGILYSDGKTMWKAENTTEDNVIFKQLFVKQAYDFIQIANQIVCTTFTNLMYIFSIYHDGAYLNLPVMNNDYNCPAVKVLNSSDYIHNILEEVKKSDTLIKKLSIEKNYITALSLSNRQDVMDNVINTKIVVYENYGDPIKENLEIVLTNNLVEYFDPESFFFLVNINIIAEHKFANILSSSLGDLRVHIVIAAETKILKVVSIKVTEILKKLSFLIPVKNRLVNCTQMSVNIRILTNIPGAFNKQQKEWIVLYRNNTTLDSNHFIKFNLRSSQNVCMKEPEEELNNLILKSAVKQFANLFQIRDTLKCNPVLKEWNMYVRLPDQYKLKLKCLDENAPRNSHKVKYFLQQLAADDFLKSKSHLTFNFFICNDKVNVQIDDDGFTKPLLKISSNNLKLALSIRNFLSDFIAHYTFSEEPGKEFVNRAFMSTVEDLQIEACLAESAEIIQLVEKFEKNIIGGLPI